MAEPISVSWVADSEAFAAAIADKQLLGVYVKWVGMPEFPALPTLSAINRAEMARIWPNLVVAEISPEQRIRYRAAGPEVVKRFGWDIAGQFLEEIATGSSLSVLKALYALTATTRATVYSRTSMTTPGITAAMVIHRLMLPLSNDRRRVDMVLGAQTFETAAGVEPDFTIALQVRSEWNCRAWVNAIQAAST
jgi:hypothetical protein